MNDEAALRNVLTQAVDSHEMGKGKASLEIMGTTWIGQRTTGEAVDSIVDGLKDHYVAMAEQKIAGEVRGDLARAESRLESLGSSREDRLAAVAQMVAESSNKRDLARALRQFGVESGASVIAEQLIKADPASIMDGTLPAASKAEAAIENSVASLREGVAAMRTQISSDEATTARGHLLTRNPIYGPNRERTLKEYGVSLSASGQATPRDPAAQVIIDRMTDHKIQGVAEDVAKDVCGALANNIVSSVLFNGLNVAMAKNSLDAARGARLGAKTEDSVALDREVVRANLELGEAQVGLISGAITSMPGVKQVKEAEKLGLSPTTVSGRIADAAKRGAESDVVKNYFTGKFASEVKKHNYDHAADEVVRGR